MPGALFRGIQITYSSIRALKNRALNLIDSPVVILVYHRVASLQTDPQLLAVTPSNFRAQLMYLKQNFHIVRFEEDWSDVEKPAVAVTFDDGYADNALQALPIIEEVGIPATFFVSTGNIDTMREYWWDDLERMIMDSRFLPESFTLKDDRFGGDWPTATATEREALYRDLQPLMKEIDPARREDWLAQLRQWAQIDEKGRASYRSMTADELWRIAGSRLVTIGAHTVTHSPLSVLTEEQQRYEILSSKTLLEKLLGTGIKVFSYPFGRKGDYNKISVRICREAGFVKAAANFPGQAHRWTDPYQLPRQLVRNWGASTFSAKLRDFWV